MNHVPRVAIIVLTYNQENETARCLASLEALSYPDAELLVVDNGSKKSAASVLSRRFPKAEWRTLPRNIGFAAGCNEGIRWGLEQGVDAFLLLNNDTVVDSDLLQKLVERSAAADPPAIVGAAVYPLENPNRPFMAGMRFDFWTARVIRLAAPKAARPMPSVSGSCFLIPKRCLETIGLLDERFFIYFEETDFCYRARRNRIKVLCEPQARVSHQGGVTFGLGSPAFRYLYTRNRLLFISKHCPLLLRPWSFCVRTLEDLALLVISFLRGRTRVSQAIFCGTVDYWKGRFGKGRLDQFFHE